MPKGVNQAAMAKAAAKAGSKKEAKKLARQLGNKVLERVVESGRDNPYLKCLVNPEQWQHSYPDNYGEKTAVCKFITNRTVTWAADGAYWVSVNPTLPDHVVTMQPSQTAGTYGYTSFTRYSPKPVTIKQGPGDYLILNPAEGAPDSLGNKKQLAVSGNNIIFPSNMTGSGTVYLETPDSASLTYTILWGDNTTNVIVPGGAGVTIPQAATKMALNITTTQTTASCTQVKLAFQLAEAAGTNTKTVVPCQNYSDLVPVRGSNVAPPIFEEYRVVGMSVLLTYEGDTLYNGGNCTGRAVSGGDSPQSLGWTDYASIASLPDSYEGPLTMGAYGFWVPTDTKDMQFRDCEVTNTDGDLPSLVFAGIVKNASNAVLRLRTCMIVEAKTYKPYISTTYSVVQPAMIDAAAIALRGIPRIMENPLHLEDIKNFLREVLKKGKAVYDAAAPVAVPLAKAIAPLLL